MQAFATVAPPRLSDVIKALGRSVARFARSNDAGDCAVSTLVLHDPLNEPPPAAGGLLLAIGVRPSGSPWRQLLSAAGERGYVCVAVKPSGVPGQELVDSLADTDLAVVVLADEVPWQQLVTLASSAMRHSDSTEPALGNTRLGDLFALANAVAGAVGGATAIVDSRQCVIAYSTIEGQPIDETRRNSILGLRVPSKPATDAEYRAVHDAPGVVHLSSTNADFPRLAVAIRAGGELLGSVWVIAPSGVVSDTTKAELQHAADIAALHLLQARTEAEVSERRRGDMLSAILDDPALAGPAATALGVQVGRPLRMAAICVTEQSLGGERVTACHQTLELAILHCRAELGFSAATVRSDLVHLLLPAGPTATDDAALTRLLSGIDAHARRSYGYRLVIGVGGVVTDLADAATSMAQAGRVVSMISRDLGRTGADGPAIGFSESYTARMALLALAEHRAGFDQAAGNTITAMLEYDAANATDYVPTLQAFFDAHGNISAMAAALHVHPNTCRYRLSRIVEVFGIELEERDARLVLGLQLRLHELTG